MEAPPPLSAATTAAASAYPDSVDSSPRSRHTDSWDSYAAPPSKLRLMCSYGGHIVPRPHDKSLCYIGGDNRVIVIERNTSLSDLHNRLSKTLLNNQPFILKYQLPNEDLDSLISVATDEDLENMVEEYDRLNTSNDSAYGGPGGLKRKPGRLRLFLFPKSPMNSVEQLLVETASTKSDEWFLDALNGKRNLSGSDHEFSESSSVNCLLGLDDDFGAKAAAVGKDAEGTKNGGNGNGNSVVNHDVHSVPDSPMPETTSSFGSTSSSPSVVANLPPIKVRMEENPKLGIEEQFQQMSIGIVANNANLPVVQKQEAVGGLVAAGKVVSGAPVVVGGEYTNRVLSEDERSDHGGYRLVQQIQPQVQLQQPQQQISQFQQKQTSVYDLPSPDSVSSEGSVRNPLSRQGQTIYQEPYIQIQSGNVPITANQVDLKSGDQNSRNKVQMQPQIQESGYVLQGHYDQNHPQLHQPQQQFIHPNAQYIPAGAVPITQYYQMYPPRQQSMIEQQYPGYYMPTRQPQAYSLPIQQPNYSELPTNAHTSQPPTPPSATISHSPAYTQGRIAPSSNPEMPAGVYRTMAPQYVGLPQFHHHPQSMAQSSAGNAHYANYEFADPNQGQIYYTHAMPPQMATQYQTMTSAPAIVSPEASTQLPTETMKQQIRAPQP